MGGIASTDTPTLFVWCCRPPSTPLVTRRRRERSSPGVKETQSARLNALVLESNSVTTMAESERPVARTMHNPLRLTTSPFSSSSSSSFSPPFFFCPSQTSWRRTNTGPIVLRLASERCRTLGAFIVMQILAAPDLQMDFYLFTPLWVFFFFSLPLSRTIRRLLESSSEHGRGW